MVMVGRRERLLLYATWYGFKKDLERRLGCHLLNDDWLLVKPKSPLPWDDSQMLVAMSEAARLVDGRHFSKHAG